MSEAVSLTSKCMLLTMRELLVNFLSLGELTDLMEEKDIFVAMLGLVDEFSKRTAEKIQSMKMSVLISRRFDYL
jgi:hypothetical protein